MNRPRRSLTVRAVTFSLLLGALSIGCGATPKVRAVTPVEVSDAPATKIAPAEFPREMHGLLLSKDRTDESKLLLAGAVQYQLSRATRLFLAGHTKEGEDVVVGALLLLRHDDELLSATRGQSLALLSAAHSAARSGDAGRAQALYELTLQVVEDERTRQDVKDHLKALRDWNESTQGNSALEKIGGQTRRSLARSVVDPSAELYIESRDNIISWMRAALANPVNENNIRSNSNRELALEAYRAIRSGAPAMIALNLRQGTPAGAVGALEDADLDRALPPGLRALLEATASDDNPDAWMSLFRQLESARNEGSAETQLPQYVTDGAAFWAAIGLYRSSPGKMEHAMPLAMTLVEFGMPEVASTLLAQNSDEKTRKEALSWSLSLVLSGLLELSRTDQLEAARRSFSEAGPLLQLAESNDLKGAGPARAKALMAALETRHGHVKRALPLLIESTQEEAHPETLIRLSLLQAQDGDLDGSKDSLSRAINAAQQSGHLLTEARAEYSLYRAHRRSGANKLAAQALERSLRRTLVVRDMDLPVQSLAGVERHLANVLEAYGQQKEVRATYARALKASRDSAIELEMTLTEMARSALTTGDLKLARLATQSALSLGLPEENCIYIALWQQTLETLQDKPHNGMSRQVLLGAKESQGWLRTLRDYGLGKVQPGDLHGLSQGITQGVEASFYLAFSGKKWPSDNELREIAESPAIDLVEVHIAQDLLAKQKKGAAPELPLDVELP